jgi:hypothetical protein
VADKGEVLYDDGGIACDESGLTIRHYYLWGPKRIPYASMRSVKKAPLGAIRGKWRIWGSGDFVHWYNLDWRRPRKEVALEIDAGGRIRPTITPDDPDAVDRILGEHLTR